MIGVRYFTDSIAVASADRIMDEAYRVYVTDCIYAITRWTGAQVERRYYDILHPSKEEDKPAKEVAYERLERFGIKVVD